LDHFNARLVQYHATSPSLQPSSSPESLHSPKVLKLPVFRHVDDNMPLEPEHPCQGALPVLKLVWQPPAQLLVAFASLASFAVTDSGAADGTSVVGDVWRATVLWVTVLRATALCFVLVTCSGASTVTPGSRVAEPVAVCDIAAPLRPHSNPIETMATVELATKSDESLIAMSSQMGTGIPSQLAR
jgi:hypothetical protein